MSLPLYQNPSFLLFLFELNPPDQDGMSKSRQGLPHPLGTPFSPHFPLCKALCGNTATVLAYTWSVAPAPRQHSDEPMVPAGMELPGPEPPQS